MERSWTVLARGEFVLDNGITRESRDGYNAAPPTHRRRCPSGGRRASCVRLHSRVQRAATGVPHTRCLSAHRVPPYALAVLQLHSRVQRAATGVPTSVPYHHYDMLSQYRVSACQYRASHGQPRRYHHMLGQYRTWGSRRVGRYHHTRGQYRTSRRELPPYARLVPDIA
eukprot:2491479-Rhodomonas_salina.1